MGTESMHDRARRLQEGRSRRQPAGERHVTFCRICEPLCGLVVTVDDGVVVKIEGDKEHPLSKGYLCPKGAAMVEVQNDPDRVREPLRRVGGPGDFEPCSWDDAMSDIEDRVRRLVARHGGSAVGMYAGNPSAMDMAHLFWAKGFVDALGSPHFYTAGSQDTNARMVASHLLYGNPLLLPFPDVPRTTFLLVVGANPLVSHGSVVSLPRIRASLLDVVERGGRVVVVDPRRSETARLFEHVPIRADTDAWLLAAMLNVILVERRDDRRFVARQTSGIESLQRWVAPLTPELAATHTGVAATEIVELARAFSSAPAAVAYGRTGTCTTSFASLTNLLLDCLNAVTGNLDAPGGAVFGTPPVSLADLGARFGMATYGRRRTRVGGFPDVAGMVPSVVMPREITTPGPGQLRALFVSAGNPVLSTPDSASVVAALRELDLLVSVDIYVNETGSLADYVLPATTFLERDDVPCNSLQFAVTPFVQATRRVVAPPAGVRQEWQIYDELARRLGLGAPFGNLAVRTAARLGLRPTPRRLVDLLVRTSRHGDWFGLRRGGLSLARLEDRPHGIVLGEHVDTGVLRGKLRHRDRRVHLGDPAIASELSRLMVRRDDPEFPLRLIGMRESRSHNSWMHNAPRLVSSHRQAGLQIHPSDAAAAGLSDGTSARLASRTGSLVVSVAVTDDMVPGTVALPHGWGHAGGWQTANAAGGVNVNLLSSSRDEDAERLSGTSWLNGIPVRVEPCR